MLWRLTGREWGEKMDEEKAGLGENAGPRDTVQVVQPTQTAREPPRIYTE